MARKIEDILVKADLLNKAPYTEEVASEKSTQSPRREPLGYVPRAGGSAHLFLLALALAIGESADQTAEQSAVDAMLHRLAPDKPILSRKLREIVRLFRAKELVELREERFALTEAGVRAAAKCLETSRLQYPQVEQFFESGGFRRCFRSAGSAGTVETGASSAPTPGRTDGAAASTPLVLPSLRWPLAPPERDVVMGERVSRAEDIAQELPDVAPVIVTGREEDWEVVLILDSREVRSLQDRSYLENHLRQEGVTCEVRSIGLGDVQWVLRNCRSGAEVMLNTLVERKNARDLAQSILDGRFHEQQYRLLHCGAKHPVYVVEGGLRTQDVLPADSLQTSIMATVVSRDIYVYQSTSIDDTIVFLKILQEILKSAVRLYFEKGDDSCFHPLKISFSDFQSLYSKAKESKLKHLWCKQLRQIPRCSVAKTLIIAKRYPTLASLMRAYSKLSSVKEKEDLLKELCDSNSKNRVGPALSRNIYHYLCSS